jgi:hypothetical protein
MTKSVHNFIITVYGYLKEKKKVATENEEKKNN